jgi:hypothetical protein
MAGLVAAVLFVIAALQVSGDKSGQPLFWALLGLAALAVQFSGVLAGVAWPGRRQ